MKRIVLFVWLFLFLAVHRGFSEPRKDILDLSVNTDDGLCSKECYTCRKWNPGHYILITSLESAKEVESIIANPGNNIKGVQVAYLWRNLEHKKGVYDFTSIEEHLNIVKKYNKQLFIVLGDRVFDANEKPVPDYLYLEQQYNGGVEPLINGGSVARIWDAAVMERCNRLVEELGKKFDNDSNFEGLAFEESSLGINVKTAKGYSPESYADALFSRIEAAAKAFPNSSVLMYMNWFPHELKKVIEYLPKDGIGLGGPDLVPDEGRFGYKERIPAYNYYPKYSGVIPLGTAVQSENLVRPEWFLGECRMHPFNAICKKDKYGNYEKRKGDFTLEGFWHMGVNTLKLNYIFWASVEDKKYKYRFRNDILPFINAKGGKINDECPDKKKILRSDCADKCR